MTFFGIVETLVRLTAELLCFYLILATMDGRGIKQAFVDLVKTKQWIKWGNIITIPLFLGSLVVIDMYNSDLMRATAVFTTPLITMYLVKERSLFKVALTWNLYIASLIMPILVYLIFAFSNIFLISFITIGSNLFFVYLDIPYKVHQWAHQKKFVKISIITIIVYFLGTRLTFGIIQTLELFYIVVFTILTSLFLYYIGQWIEYRASRQILQQASKKEIHDFLAEKSSFIGQKPDIYYYEFDARSINKRLERDILKALEKHQLRCYNKRCEKTQQLTLIVHEPSDLTPRK